MLSNVQSATCRCVCKLRAVPARYTATIALDDVTGLVGNGPSTRQEVTPDVPSPLRALDTAKPFTEIPGPRGLPLIGNALKYSRFGPYSFEKILDNRLSYMEQYGKIYKEKLGTMWIVHLFDPSDVAAMFRLEGKYPSRGTIANLEVTYLKRNSKLIGFAFLDGPEWARQRSIVQKLMVPPTAAARYLHVQVPVAQDFTKYLHDKMDSDGIVPNLYDDLFKYTMETIGTVCFAERLGAFGNQGNPTEEAARLSNAIAETFFCFRNALFSFPWYQYWRTPLYRRFEKAANTMKGIMAGHVKNVQKRLEADGASRRLSSGGDVSRCPFGHGGSEEDRSLYEVMMEDDRLSADLRENFVMALFRTGIDSTGNALSFFLYNLANNPEKQAKLYDEIRKVLPNDEPLSIDTLKDMHYLKACLRESFRLHFPVFGGSGRVLSEDVAFSGYKVPKGTFIFVNMAAMSRMDEYFQKPTEYHPERWMRDDSADMRTVWPDDAGFLSLPFSHGLRACPGRRFAEQGLYLAVVSILQKFKLEYHKDEMGMIHMPFTCPDKPLDIKFIPRTEPYVGLSKNTQQLSVNA